MDHDVILALDGLEQFTVIFDVQLREHARDQAYLGRPDRLRLAYALQDVLGRQLEPDVVAERAELAADDAAVGDLDEPVDHVGHRVADDLLT